METDVFTRIVRRTGWITLAIGAGCFFLVEPLFSLSLWKTGGLLYDPNLYWWRFIVVTLDTVVSSMGMWLIAAAIVLLIVARVTRTMTTLDAPVDQVNDEDAHA